jgi:PBP1b-binding outer membrane lipoprotein LpoB
LKKIYLVVLLVLMISTLFLSGCSKNSPPVNSQPTAAGVAATSAGSSTEDAKIEALIREKLQDHHSIDRIFNARHTREEWNTTLDRMISYGAKMSEAEKQQIIDWLMARNN